MSQKATGREPLHTGSTASHGNGSRHTAHGQPLTAWAVVAALPLLTACHDDHDHFIQVPPTEVSLGLVAGNFTGNGHTSIIATSTVLANPQANLGNLKLYLSTGAGTFAAPAFTPDGLDPLYLASADLNGDGIPDVVSASFNDGALTVFINNSGAPGTFGAPVILPSPGASQLAIADVNGDGLPDLVSADFYVSLFLQSSPGVFATPVPLYPGGANWVAVGDLNGDNLADVALTDNAGVHLLLHTGTAADTTFAAPVLVYPTTAGTAYPGANLIAIADVNGDGLNDLVITDPGPAGGEQETVEVLLQDAANKGQFLPAVAYPTPAHNLAQSIIVTDVNGDGHPDIVIGGTQSVVVLLQDSAGGGTFQAAAAYTAPHSGEIAVADVDGDGRPDIIVTTGPSQPLVNGVYTNTPGVLLQSATTPGTFGTLEALP